MLGLATPSGLPLNASQIPTNLTAMKEQLRSLSESLKAGGSFYNALDQLGNVSSMVYECVPTCPLFTRSLLLLPECYEELIMLATCATSATSDTSANIH